MSDFQGSLEFKIKHHLNRDIGGGVHDLRGKKIIFRKDF